MIVFFFFACLAWQGKCANVSSKLENSSEELKAGVYSGFLFLGDSLIARWLCFRKGSSASLYPSAECNNVINTYFDTVTNLAVDCTVSSSYYCKSAFQSAFPGAITLAVRGYTIQDVTNRARTYQPLQLLSRGSVRGAPTISKIIIEIGTNNLIRQSPVSNTQFLAGASLQPLIALYNTMLSEVHLKFPRARILLLSVAPHNSDYSVDNRFRASINSLLKTTYTNSLAYPYVRFATITQYFEWFGYPGNVVQAYYVDSVHFSASGYGKFESAIKDSIRTAF